MNKKFISWVSALALASSVIAVPAAVNAADGDVLLSQNFDAATVNDNVTYNETADGEAVPWGGASRGKAVTGYVSVADTVTADTTTVPESVTGIAMVTSTNAGENVSVKYDIKPDLSATADVYNVTFDIYLRNGAHGLGTDGATPTDPDELALYKYKIGFGASTVDSNGNATATDMFDFHVLGNAVNIVSNGTDIDTGIVTGDDGVWVKVDMNLDTTQKKMTGTITPESGEAYSVQALDFSNTSASTITQLFVSSERQDSSHKGRVNSYIDNFVVKEAVAATYAPVTISFVDSDGNTIKDSITDQAIVGAAYTVPDADKAQINDDTNNVYYTYASGADAIESVSADGAAITLVFDKHDYVSYSVKAVSGDTELAVITSGTAANGTSVSYAAKYAYVVDGKYYVPAADAVLSGSTTIGAEDTNLTIEYAEKTDAAGAVYNFDDTNAVDPFTYKDDHMSGAISDGILTVTADSTAGSSDTGDNQRGEARLSINSYADYSTVVLNFDSKISGSNSVRMIASLLTTAEASTYNDGGIFSIGTKDGGGYRIQGTQNANGADVWTTSSIKIDVENSKCYYEVINRETGALIASGSADMTDSAKTLVFLSWLPNSSAGVDNVEIVAIGKNEQEYAEGSDIDLLPSTATKISNMSAVEGDATQVANHSKAKPAVAGNVSTYETKNKNKSIYAAFDVYIASGDKLTLTEYNVGDSTSQGGMVELTGNVDGSVGLKYTSNDKGDTGAATNSMVCGTWYRVLLETPQVDGDSTSTGVSTLTISKIDASDCSKTTDVVASCEIAARNLTNKSCTLIQFAVEGTPYIDNGVVYKDSTTTDPATTWYQYVASYNADGTLDTVTVTTVEDPSTVDTSGNTDTAKTFVWNGLMKPYQADTTADTTE